VGNAIGDTVVAVRHFYYWKALIPKSVFTVWTTDSEVWSSLSSGHVKTIAFLDARRLRFSYDLIIYDWVTPGDDCAKLLAATPAAKLFLASRAGNVAFQLGTEAPRVIRLPPMTNHTYRVDEIYEALGFQAGNELSTRKPQPVQAGKFIVFVNCAASWSAKSIPVYFAGLLIRRLSCLEDRNTKVLVSVTKPNPMHGDEERTFFAHLNECILRESERSCVKVIDGLSKSEYVKLVEGASLVIGPDTSSQHIASFFGIPSITCYSEQRSHMFYFWNSLKWNAIGIKIPAEGQKRSERATLTLICEIASAFKGQGRSRWASASRREVARAAVGKIRSALDWAAKGDHDLGFCKTIMEEQLYVLATTLPKSWRSVIIDDLKDSCAAVLSRSAQVRDSPDAIALKRIEQLNCLKTLDILLGSSFHEKLHYN